MVRNSKITNLILENMNATAHKNPLAFARAALLGLTVFLAPSLTAAGSKNPVGKLYVAVLGGTAELAARDHITDLKKQTAHPVNESVIETKKALAKVAKGDDKADYSAMVFSNGTGIYLEPESRLEVQKFVQEPFAPNRTDMDLEPSVSHTQTLLAHGTVGLCTPKMSNGSTMVYRTALGIVNIRGRRVVIESNDEFTRISMLEGESTVRPATDNVMDLGGQILRAGQQALIRRGQPGRPPVVQIDNIPQVLMAALDDKVAMACLAKKTVYFEAVDRNATSGTTGTTDSLVAGASDGPSAGGNSVSAFDDAPAQEIIAVNVVPVKLPVEFTVSPARVVP